MHVRLSEILTLRAIKSFKNIFIIDEQHRLVGVVSQGDILNHIRIGGAINIELRELTNFNPVYVFNKKYNKASIKKLFYKYQITEIPVVDDNLQPLKIINVFDLLKE